MIMVAGIRVAGDEGFLILTTYAGAPQSWPLGATTSSHLIVRPKQGSVISRKAPKPN